MLVLFETPAGYAVFKVFIFVYTFLYFLQTLFIMVKDKGLPNSH